METTTTPETLAPRLKEGTRALHDQAESKPFQKRVMAGELPLEAYVDSLEQHYLIYKEMEAVARPLRPDSEALALLIDDGHFHAERAAADLRHFGRDPEQARPIPATTAFIEKLRAESAKSPAYLVGCFYVYEGSLNGGRYIAKKLRAVFELPEEGNPGMEFMDPYGPAQPKLWKEFKEKLDSLPFDEEESAAAVEAAKSVFVGIMGIGDEICARYDAKDAASEKA